MKTVIKAILIILLLMAGIMGKKVKKLGVTDGKFIGCPDSPNCVSTQADPTDKEHYIKPITYSASKEETMNKISGIINKMERTKIITREENYLHVEFRTKVMKYVDDVEFYLDDEKKVIHFRSASRVGYSDMGTNRKRMEDFRTLYLK